MHDVFISYSSEQRHLIELLSTALTKLGLTVWYDKLLVPGKPYETGISDALDVSSCALVCWSPEARESMWVIDEATRGFRQKKLVTVVVSGDPQHVTPMPFSGLNSKDLRLWFGHLNLRDETFVSILKAVAENCNKSDLINWCNAVVSNDKNSLQKWIAENNHLIKEQLMIEAVSLLEEIEASQTLEEMRAQEAAERRAAEERQKAHARNLALKKKLKQRRDIIIGAPTLMLAGALGWLGFRGVQELSRKSSLNTEAKSAWENTKHDDPAELREFMSRFSESAMYARAKQILDEIDAELLEYTKTGSLESYEKYIANFPVSEHPVGSGSLFIQSELTKYIRAVGVIRDGLVASGYKLNEDDSNLTAVATEHATKLGIGKPIFGKIPDTGIRSLAEALSSKGVISTDAYGFVPRQSRIYSSPQKRVFVSFGTRYLYRIDPVRGRASRIQLSPNFNVRDKLVQSHDGTLVAAGYSAAGHEKGVAIWDCDTGQVILRIADPDDKYVSGYAFTPDGKKIVITFSDGIPRVWEIATNKFLMAGRELKGHELIPFENGAKAWTLKGEMIELSEVNLLGSARYQNPSRNRLIQTDFVEEVSMSGNYFLFSKELGYRDYEYQYLAIDLMKSGAAVALEPFSSFDDFHGKKIERKFKSATFVGRSDKILTGHHDGTINLYSSSSGSCLETIASVSEIVSKVSTSSDSKWAAVSTEVGNLFLIDLAKKKVVRKYSIPAFRTIDMRFGSDDSLLLGLTSDKSAFVFFV